jgi:hypothetical protein
MFWGAEGRGRAVDCQRFLLRQSSVSRIIIVEEEPIFIEPFITTFSPNVFSKKPPPVGRFQGIIPPEPKISALNTCCLQQKSLHVKTPKTFLSTSIWVVAFLSPPLPHKLHNVKQIHVM